MLHIGEKVTDFAFGKGNPRNSEGAFLALKDGRILLIYSRFDGDKPNDESHCGLSASISQDGGLTWMESRKVIGPEDDHAANIMSVSLLRMKNGDIGLFYLAKRGTWNTRLCLRRSSDDGETWGPSVSCIPYPGYYVVNNDRVIRLKNGRLMIPAACHRTHSMDLNDLCSVDSRGTLFFYYSDDDGLTWKESGNSLNINAPHSYSGLQEPGVIELKNGNLWAWSRTDLGRQYESFSGDGGETWSAPVPSVFTSHCSPLSMKRVPFNDYLIAVWNPNGYTPMNRSFMQRTPLAAAYSKDEGNTWSDCFILEDDPDKNYCYTAIHFLPDGALFAYCVDEKIGDTVPSTLRIKKVFYQEFGF